MAPERWTSRTESSPRLTRKRLTKAAMPIALILELSLGVTWLMMETQMGSFCG